MKTALKISVLLNLGLLAGLMFFWANPRKEAPALPPAVTKVEAPAPVVSAPPVVRTVVESRPFRWDQLVSTNDYRVFVANLRKAGCPEPTVEDIVRGDTERAFFFERGKLHIADANEPGPWSAQAQMEMVAFLLGETLAQEVAADTPSSQPLRNRPRPERPASMPLVLQNIDLAALGLDDDQMQMITNTRANFLDQIGGTNQNANDPAYLARWQQAQLQADADFRVDLGPTAFWKYQELASGQKAAEQQSSQN